MSIRGLTIRRVLIKLSGEALMGDDTHGIQTETINRISQEIKSVRDLGIQVCVVVGGGNIFRGINGEEQGIERTTADHMGMLATLINALALQSVMEKQGIAARVMSALTVNQICEPYTQKRSLRHLEKGRVVIFAGGTGNPYFTTDTAATLRASEMKCDVLMKGTKVDGVYTDDPKKVENAEFYTDLTYTEVLSRHLKAMDAAAIALARENHIPVVVFNIRTPNTLLDVIQNRGKFTFITDSKD